MQEPAKTVVPFRLRVNPLPAKEWLDELFEYRPEEGLFWKMRPLSHFKTEVDWAIWNTRYALRDAGAKVKRLRNGHSVHDHRRVQVPLALGCKRIMSFTVHRIAFAMMGVEIPAGMVIDHINGDAWDNRWSNLRISNHRQNVNNSGGWRTRKHDLPKGVYFDPTRAKPYYAMLKNGEKYLRLPNRHTIEEARADYCAKATELHGEFVNLGRADGD